MVPFPRAEFQSTASMLTSVTDHAHCHDLLRTHFRQSPVKLNKITVTDQNSFPSLLTASP